MLPLRWQSCADWPRQSVCPRQCFRPARLLTAAFIVLLVAYIGYLQGLAACDTAHGLDTAKGTTDQALQRIAALEQQPAELVLKQPGKKDHESSVHGLHLYASSSVGNSAPPPSARPIPNANDKQNARDSLENSAGEWLVGWD